MPKSTDPATKSKSKNKSSVVAIPGLQPAQKRGGKVSAQPPPVKRQNAAAVIKRKRAVVAKVAKGKGKGQRVVASDDDDDSAPSSEEEEFPEDGMDVQLSFSGDDQTTAGGVLDFIDDLNLFEDDDDDEEHALAASDDNIHPRKRKVSSALTLTSSTPTGLRGSKGLATPTKPDFLASGSGLFTPYIPRVNAKDPSKPLLSLQSPLTRNIIKKVQQRIRSRTVTQDAFPDPDTLVDVITDAVVSVAQSLDAPRRVLRYKDDPVYQESIQRMAKRGVTGLRSEVANTARDLVGPGHQLGPGRGSPAQNKAYVTMLATNGNHVYRTLETVEQADGTFCVTKRAGPYRHGTIADIILQEFFTCHEQMAVVELTKDLFNPIPLPVIAFSATVMQCALRDWTNGVRVKSSSDFSADEWSACYKAHLRQLEHMRDVKPEDVDRWTRKLWKDCWSATSQFLANHIDEDESFVTADELDDFEDVEADA